MTRLIFILLLPYFVMSQSNTEVFLFDLGSSNGQFELSNYRNISNNDGYDNQPSFLNNNTVLFSSTRKDQTDIARYDVNYGSKIWINFTEGSEYSPIKIPGENAVSAIRLDKDGKQQLMKYNLSNGESDLLFDDPVVGYHCWFNKDVLVASILDEGSLSLITYYFNENKHYKFQKKVGRSLHKIPDTDLISYISKEDDNLWEIKSVDPISGATKGIMGTLPQQEDMCWLPDGTILMAYDDLLYTYKPGTDVDWIERLSLKEYNISKISRLTVSPDGTKLAVVGEGVLTKEDDSESDKEENTGTISEEVENIVQIQLEAYNKRDIDAFMATYADDIKLYNYPEELRTDGKTAMRQSYDEFFKRTPDLKAVIQKRIVLGNKVIDEEHVTINGQLYKAVAIYEVEDGLIKKVTFIQ
ncbi:MAG: nuclear transport factor 2 family protein [Bacteroidia bacterium]|nr:nuclear transport factor 2 family protein [Bacteroidia bacterium]